jgi:hypothetical protein
MKQKLLLAGIAALIGFSVATVLPMNLASILTGYLPQATFRVTGNRAKKLVM